MSSSFHPNTHWFTKARYGLFVHFGLYSLLARGEWVMNREGISPEVYCKLAQEFHADAFDAEAIADLAVASGMRYIVFTTMHHEGFRLYDTKLSDYCSTKTRAGRDLTAELVKAAKDRGLKIGLYHSLNNWFDQPDAVAALEDPSAYRIFIDNTFARIRELVEHFNPIDILWYDGWWPFEATGWKGEEMNAMVQQIQPHILFNGRNGLPGDFATPEGHVSAPVPWRPWEASMTLNDHWGFYKGDQAWKSSREVIKMLARTAQGKGNLLLNIGLCGDGAIPAESVRILREVGDWLKINGECIFDTDFWTLDPYQRGNHRGDWCHHGLLTAKGNNLYLIATAISEKEIILGGIDGNVRKVYCLGHSPVNYKQEGSKLTLSIDPGVTSKALPPVFRMEFDCPPSMYLTGGMRVPQVPHPHYDPCPSDIHF